MDPESPIAIRNGRLMGLSYKLRALASGRAVAPQGIPVVEAAKPVTAPDAVWIDAGHLREVLNGNDMPAYCSSNAGHGLVQLLPAAEMAARNEELYRALALMVRTHDEPADTPLQEMFEQKWLESARTLVAKYSSFPK